MTSRTEGMPIPGVEAMASGCLFITTNSGGVLEYAKNQVNSIVLEKPEDLWEKDIIEELINNPNKMRKLILNGHITASEYWEDNIVEDMEKILF